MTGSQICWLTLLGVPRNGPASGTAGLRSSLMSLKSSPPFLSPPLPSFPSPPLPSFLLLLFFLVLLLLPPSLLFSLSKMLPRAPERVPSISHEVILLVQPEFYIHRWHNLTAGEKRFSGQAGVMRYNGALATVPTNSRNLSGLTQ